MLDYLESLRKRPEPERKKAVLKISLSVTIVIVLVWGAFIYMRVSHTDFSFDSKKFDTEAPDFKAAVSNFIDGMSAAFKGAAAAPAASSSAATESRSDSKYPGLDALFSTSTEGAGAAE